MKDMEYLDALRHRLVDSCEGWETAATAGYDPTPAELHAVRKVAAAAMLLSNALEAAMVRAGQGVAA